jgi:hypothetical protein
LNADDEWREPVSESLPATIAQIHPNADLVLDNGSAALLN